MRTYEFVVEYVGDRAATVKVEHENERDARLKLWKELMTEDQRDACECIELVEVRVH